MVGYGNQQLSTRMVTENLDSIAGGTVGVGAPAVLRETADVRGGQPVALLGQPSSMLGRATRPSVAWGVGVGSLTGLLWWMDAGGRALQDFYLAHTATGIPTGIASFLLPKEGGTGGGGDGAEGSALARFRSSSSPRSSASGAENDGEFAAADGEIGAAQ